MTVSRAVVLGGGGRTGFAWQWGVIAQLLDAGIPLHDADLFVGTSAGSVAAAHILDGVPQQLLAELLDPPGDDPDLAIDEEPFITIVKQLIMSGRTADELRNEFCAKALAADSLEEARLLRNANKFVPKPEWPAQRFLIPAIDAHTGELTVFHQDTGVDFVEAVAAACAVPGVWEPITIGDNRYLDAIIRSPVNPDLAAGTDRVLVIAPIPELRGLPGAGLDDLLAPVRTQGTVVVITPSEAARIAIGRDQGDLSRRPEATRAGLAQATELADAVTALWGD